MANGGIGETGLFTIKAQTAGFQDTINAVNKLVADLNKNAVIKLQVDAVSLSKMAAQAKKTTKEKIGVVRLPIKAEGVKELEAQLRKALQTSKEIKAEFARGTAVSLAIRVPAKETEEFKQKLAEIEPIVRAIEQATGRAVNITRTQVAESSKENAAKRESLRLAKDRERTQRRLAQHQQQAHQRELRNIQAQAAAMQRKAGQQDRIFRKQLEQTSQLGFAMNRFGSRMSFLLTAIVAQFVFEITTEASGQFIKLEGSIRGLEVAASRAGAAGSQLFKQLTAEADEFNFKMQEAAESINKLLIGGLQIDKGEVQRAKETALGATVLFGTDPSKNLNDLASAALRTSRRIADNLGILVRTNEAFEKYAKTLDITKDKLTGTMKSQAFWNAMLESSGAAALRAASELDTYTKEMFAAHVQLDKIKLAFGEVITAGLMPFIRTLNELDQAQIENIASSTVMAAKIIAVVGSFQALVLIGRQAIAVVTKMRSAFVGLAAAQAAFATARGAEGAAMLALVRGPIGKGFQAAQMAGAQRELAQANLVAAKAKATNVAASFRLVAGLAAVAAAAAITMAAIDNYNKRLMEVDRINLDLAQTNIQVTGALEALGLKFKTTSAELTKIQTLMEGFNAKGAQMNESTRKATESMVNLAKEIADTASELDRVSGAEAIMAEHTANVEEALARMIEKAEAATEGSEDLKEASIKVGDALKDEVLPEIGEMIEALALLAEANVLAAMAGQTAWEQFASGFVKVGAGIIDTIVNIIKAMLGLRTAQQREAVRRELLFGDVGDVKDDLFLRLLPQQPELQISQAELTAAQQALANVRGIDVQTQPITVQSELERKQLQLGIAEAQGRSLKAAILRGKLKPLEDTKKFIDGIVELGKQFDELEKVGVELDELGDDKDGKAGKAAKTRAQLFEEFIAKQRKALDKLDLEIQHQTTLAQAGSDKAQIALESLEAKKQQKLIEIAQTAQLNDQGDLLAKETDLLGQINEALRLEMDAAKNEKLAAIQKNIDKYLEQEQLNADINAGLKEFGIKVDDSATMQSIITDALKATEQNAERVKQLFAENSDIAMRALKAGRRELKAAEELADAKANELARARQRVLDEDFAFAQALITSREADPALRRRIETQGLLDLFERQLGAARDIEPGGVGALEAKRGLQDLVIAINEAATSMRDDFTKEGLATLPDLLDEVQRRALAEIDRLAAESPFSELEAELLKLTTAADMAAQALANIVGVAAPALVGGGNVPAPSSVSFNKFGERLADPGGG